MGGIDAFETRMSAGGTATNTRKVCRDGSHGGRGVNVAVGRRVSDGDGVGDKYFVGVLEGVKVGVFVNVGVMVGDETRVGVLRASRGYTWSMAFIQSNPWRKTSSL